MKCIKTNSDNMAWRCFAVCVVLITAACSDANQRSWDIGSSRTLVYDVEVMMAHDGNEFTERDTRVIEIVIDAGEVSITRTSSIEATSVNYGPYTFAEDGTIGGPETLVNPPPLEAELILHVFPPGGLGTRALPASWATVDPPDSMLGDDKIELQQRTEFTFLGHRAVGGMDFEDYALQSTVRLIDNGRLSDMIGIPSERTIDLQNTIDDLSRDNLFLFGTVSWNRQDRVTENCEFTYVSAPHAAGTEASIGASEIRQEMTVRRR